MAAIIIPRTLKNFNVFIEGISYAGRVSKGKLPSVSTKTEDHMGGGMEFNRKLDQGLEDLECSFTLTEHNEEIQGLVARRLGSNTLIMFRGALSDDESINATHVIANIRGSISKNETGDYEATAKVEIDFTVNCKFFSYFIGGKEIYYIDNDNYVRRVFGIDQLAAQRAALGL